MQLAFTPGSLEASFYQSEPPTFEVAATAGGVLPEPGTVVNVGIIDSNGVLQANAQVLQTSSTTFKATLRVAPSLAVGAHKGAIVVRACQDDPRTCAKPIAGSPWNLSYSFTVRPETDAHVLDALPDSANYYGSTSHNALSSAALDPSRFNRRWSNANAGGNLPSAAGNGQVFLAWIGGSSLAAHSERDGSQTWLRSMGGQAASGPSLDGNRLFIVTVPNLPPFSATLRSFDATSGQPVAQVELRGPMTTTSNPVVRNGKVYLCSSSSSLSRYDAATLKHEWTTSLDGNSLSPVCSPAVDDRYAYIYQKAGFFIEQPSLQAYDLATGAMAFKILAPSEGYYPWEMQQAPVLGPNGRIYFALWDPTNAYAFVSRLLAFDTVKRTVAWNVVVTMLNSNAVVGTDAVYVANSNALEAHSLDTGDVLWSWKSGESSLGDFNSPLLIVGKHAFVSNSWRTFAVDLTTHQEVWRDTGGGPMTLSPTGALYVYRQFSDGMRAFNLH